MQIVTMTVSLLGVTASTELARRVPGISLSCVKKLLKFRRLPLGFTSARSEYECNGILQQLSDNEMFQQVRECWCRVYALP